MLILDYDDFFELVKCDTQTFLGHFKLAEWDVHFYLKVVNDQNGNILYELMNERDSDYACYLIIVYVQEGIFLAAYIIVVGN